MTHETEKRLCERTYCIWHPGEPVEGCHCLYRWSGAIPCTGSYVCMMCGEPAPEPIKKQAEISAAYYAVQEEPR